MDEKILLQNILDEVRMLRTYLVKNENVSYKKEKEKQIIDSFIDYFVDNCTKVPITRTDLRQLNLINGNKFKGFFESHYNEIKNKLEKEHNLLLCPYNCNKNIKAYYLMKV